MQRQTKDAWALWDKAVMGLRRLWLFGQKVGVAAGDFLKFEGEHAIFDERVGGCGVGAAFEVIRGDRRDFADEIPEAVLEVFKGVDVEALHDDVADQRRAFDEVGEHRRQDEAVGLAEVHRADVGQRRSEGFHEVGAAGGNGQACLVGGEHELFVDVLVDVGFWVVEFVSEFAGGAEGGDGDGVADWVGFFRGDGFDGAAEGFDVVGHDDVTRHVQGVARVEQAQLGAGQRIAHEGEPIEAALGDVDLWGDFGAAAGLCWNADDGQRTGDVGLQQRGVVDALRGQQGDAFASFEGGITANGDDKIHLAFTGEGCAGFEVGDAGRHFAGVQVDGAFNIVKIETEEDFLLCRVGIVKAGVHDQHGVLAHGGDELGVFSQGIFLEYDMGWKFVV